MPLSVDNIEMKHLMTHWDTEEVERFSLFSLDLCAGECVPGEEVEQAPAHPEPQVLKTLHSSKQNSFII